MIKKYVICKTCGYIVEEGKVHDVCPACGAPRGAFDPYKPIVTKKRETIMALHLHPIILHFTQALVVLSFVFILASMISTGSIKDFMIVGVQINTVLLPLCVIAGALSGIIDGKARFKSVSTPLLKNKILLSILLFITTLVPALMIILMTLTTGTLAILLVLSLVSMIIAVVLGKKGAPLMTAVYPG